MNTAAKSIFVFGIYLAGLGIILITTPNVLLTTVGFAPTNEVWVRVIGVLILFFAYYFIRAAHKNLIDFFRWSVHVRASLIFFFVAFVLLGLASPSLILFGVGDLLGAIWTGLALQSV